MRAERDDDEFEREPRVRRQPERRLAYEIALGIVIGGCVLGVIELLANMLTAAVFMQQIKVTLPF